MSEEDDRQEEHSRRIGEALNVAPILSPEAYVIAPEHYLEEVAGNEFGAMVKTITIGIVGVAWYAGKDGILYPMDGEHEQRVAKCVFTMPQYKRFVELANQVLREEE